MKKIEYKLDFMLKGTPVSTLWECIASKFGLEVWFADKVNFLDEEKAIVFEWNDHIQKADIKRIKQNEYIRLRWREDVVEKCFFEFRIEKNELTGDITLLITDYSTAENIEDDIALWQSCVEKLQRHLGV